ncbi:MAG: cellulose-binding domain-containing protein [Firmicutes bacterium]|nr:cellulose-binding domain-containing protein [Bacillota bacterium]
MSDPNAHFRGSYRWISVKYVISSDWGSGASISVTITNNTTAVVNGWTLAFTLPGNQTIINLWNGSFIQSGALVSEITITSPRERAPLMSRAKMV